MKKMRVNELVYRVDEHTFLQIRDLSRDIELNGYKKDITESEYFKNFKIGNLIVTSIGARVGTSAPNVTPIIVVIAEK